MVIRFILFFLLPLSYCEAISVILPAQVTVQPVTPIFENQPIQCKITIIRTPEQKVDLTSFSLDGNPLSVQFVEDVKPPSDGLFKPNDPDALLVSTYAFTLPGKSKGLYIINEVSVHVGTITVSSIPVTYEVIMATASSELSLESKIVTSSPIYPGVDVLFEYRIIFEHPIELTLEQLPLLSADGFQNIGAPKLDTTQEGKNTVQLISQHAVATKPGVYKFEPSIIEGHTFTINSEGQRVIQGGEMRATTPPSEITVLPFPAKEKPASFNGAIGVFNYKLSLVTQNAVTYEELYLHLTVTGNGNINTVTISPDSLKRQLSSEFQVSDIPPTSTSIDRGKRFEIILRPLASSVKEIPPLEFSSFDPILRNYFIVKTDAIALQVKEAKKQNPSTETIEQNKNRVAAEKEGLSLIEINGNIALEKKDIEIIDVPLSLLFGMIFSAFVIYIVEYILCQSIKNKSKLKAAQSSRNMLLMAIKKKSTLEESLPLIREALLQRLYEAGETKEKLSHPEALLTTGIQGDIRKFLLSLQEKQFSGLVSGLALGVASKDIIDQAAELYHRLERSPF